MLKLEKRITLHTFDVEYIDQREPKPRAVHHELCVLDGGRVSALERLGQSPASWICQQYARQGFTVGAVHKGERLTANVDTATLWGMAVQQAGTQHKSAAQRKVQEYENSPIVQTLRMLLLQGDGTWTGNAGKLMELGREYTHEELAPSSQALAKAVAELEPMLWERDAIKHWKVKNGSGGKQHRFKMNRTDNTNELPESEQLSLQT